MKKNYLTIILAVALFSGAVWAADAARSIISGRYVGYVAQNSNGKSYLWVLDSENGSVKACVHRGSLGDVECTRPINY